MSHYFKRRSIILLLVFAVMASSCSFEKRIHMNGYHVEWLKRGPHRSLHLVENKKRGCTIESANSKNISVAFHADTLRIIRGTNQLKPNAARCEKFSGEECDVIVLRNGNEIKATAIVVGERFITFKYCNKTDTTTQTRSRSQVYMIRYANGQAENILTPRELRVQRDAYKPREPLSTVAVGFLIAGILLLPFGGPVLLLASFVLGMISLRKFARNPGKWRGKSFAKMVVVISGVLLALIIAAIIYVAVEGFSVSVPIQL